MGRKLIHSLPQCKIIPLDKIHNHVRNHNETKSDWKNMKLINRIRNDEDPRYYITYTPAGSFKNGKRYTASQRETDEA